MAEIDDLIRLASTDSDGAAEAWDDLSRRGAAAVRAIVDAIEPASAPARGNLGQALMRTGAPDTVPALVELLDHEYFDVRFGAYVALGLSGDTEATEALLPRLDAALSSESAWAARALGDLGDSRALEPLRERLSRLLATGEFQYEANLAAALIVSLASFNDFGSAATLLDLVASDAPEARIDAAEGLPHVITPGMVATLTTILADQTQLTEVRIRVVDALFFFGVAPSIEAFVRHMEDADPAVREHVRYRLGGLIGIELPTQSDAEAWWSEHQTEYTVIGVHRNGRLLRLGDLVDAVARTDSDWRSVLGELRLISGATFNTSPFMTLLDAEQEGVATRVQDWWSENGAGFAPGHLYKHGHPEDLSLVI